MNKYKSTADAGSGNGTSKSSTRNLHQQVFYSNLVRPTSMRSQYWKYFGFPADETGTILTRHKIICTICHATVQYNKNTTNLKAHLSIRHPIAFKDLNVKTVQKTKFIFSPNVNKSALQLAAATDYSTPTTSRIFKPDADDEATSVANESNGDDCDESSVSYFVVETDDMVEEDVDDANEHYPDCDDMMGQAAVVATTETSNSPLQEADGAHEVNNSYSIVEEIYLESEASVLRETSSATSVTVEPYPITDEPLESNDIKHVENDDDGEDTEDEWTKKNDIVECPRAKAIAEMVIETGFFPSLISSHAFQQFCSKLDPNFTVPSKLSVSICL